MSKTKGNREANQILGYKEHRKYNFNLVKHGNKPFISDEQGNR